MKETFFETLKKRRIWKTIVGYPAASFVILQAVDFLYQNMVLIQRH